MPVIFVSHGAPTLLTDGTKAEKFFRDLPDSFGRPKGILAVSAHWETKEFTVSTINKQKTIYDFYGFPEELYRFRYEPDGAPELALRTKELLETAGIKTETEERGLDHGAWVPLYCMYPKADIPVTQLSIKKGASPAEFIEAGRVLSALSDEGYLILASGSTTHNLADFGRFARHAEATEYAVLFDEWLDRAVQSGDTDMLMKYREAAPESYRNHPTDDHFVPLLVAAGAGGGKGVKLHEEFVYGFLSLSAYRWD